MYFNNVNKITKVVIYSQLIAKRKNFGGYIIYVFKNLNSNEYLMCTKLPNWNSAEIEIGDIGFLNYKEVIGGTTQYFDVYKNKSFYYKYDNIYFESFIKENKVNPLLV